MMMQLLLQLAICSELLDATCGLLPVFFGAICRCLRAPFTAGGVPLGTAGGMPLMCCVDLGRAFGLVSGTNR